VSTVGWDELYKEVEAGVVSGIPGGNYPIVIDSVRVNKKLESRMLFVDMLVEAGPLAGKVAQIKLYIPAAGNKNAGFYFLKKIAGLDMKAGLANAQAVDPDGTNVEGALNAIADALVGQRTMAEVTLLGEDAGQYAGNNELVATKPLDGAMKAAVATPATPAPAAEKSEADEIAALKAKLAAAEGGAKAKLDNAGVDF
jgi:hypothetical protein